MSNYFIIASSFNCKTRYYLLVEVPEYVMGRGGRLYVAGNGVAGAGVYVDLLLPLHSTARL